MKYSQDAIRLLYAIKAYSMPKDAKEPVRWLKLDRLHVIAHLGVVAEVFKDYDLAPALFPFRGIKMFAMISQEVAEEVNGFFHEHLVEKLLLNSWFYATVTGLRVTAKGLAVLEEDLTAEDKKAVDSIIRCSKCGQSVDFAVAVEDEPEVHLVMNSVCNCTTHGRHRKDDDWLDDCPPGAKRIDNFFSIGEAEYKAKAFFLGN